MGTLKTTNIQTITGSGTLTLGTSGETLALGSGVTSNILYPAFEAYQTTTQALTTLTITKAQLGTERFDTDNCYDNSTNYRFTPTVAGKYYVYTQILLYGTSDLDRARTFIYKNGSSYARGTVDPVNSTPMNQTSVGVSQVIDMNGSSDYLEIFVEAQGAATLNIPNGFDSYFGAYRIGT